MLLCYTFQWLRYVHTCAEWMRAGAGEKLASSQIITCVHIYAVAERRRSVNKIGSATNGSNTQFSASASKPRAPNHLCPQEMADPPTSASRMCEHNRDSGAGMSKPARLRSATAPRICERGFRYFLGNCPQLHAWESHKPRLKVLQKRGFLIMSNSSTRHLSTNWTDFLQRDLVKSGSLEIWVQAFAIALKYDRRLSGITTERPVKFQSDLGLLTSNHGLSLCGKKLYIHRFLSLRLANPKSGKMKPVLVVSVR